MKKKWMGLTILFLVLVQFGCVRQVEKPAQVLFFDWSVDSSIHYVVPSVIQTLPVTNIEDEYGSFWAPITSPNGNWVVSIDSVNDIFRLHISFRGGEEKIIPIPESIFKYQWAPDVSFDGDEIFITVSWGDSKNYLNVTTYQVDPAASEPFREVKESTFDRKYSVYYDNCGLPWQEKIVIYEFADPDIYRYKVRITPNLLYDVKTGTTSVVEELGDDWSICSRWSPDMKSSLYMTSLENPDRLCWILNSGGRDTEVACFPSHPSGQGVFTGWQFLMGNGVWSPDGNYFALVAQNSATEHDVLIYDKSGKLVSQAIGVGEMPESWLGVLHWSPDSKQVAFVAQFDSPGVYTLDLSGKIEAVYTSRSCIVPIGVDHWATEGECDVVGWMK